VYGKRDLSPNANVESKKQPQQPARLARREKRDRK
jgi:hypothetical protein